MSKKILKYTSVVLGSLVLLIIYLSTVGFETDKFNNQIQNLVKQKNDKFDTSLKKMRLNASYLMKQTHLIVILKYTLGQEVQRVRIGLKC